MTMMRMMRIVGRKEDATRQASSKASTEARTAIGARILKRLASQSSRAFVPILRFAAPLSTYPAESNAIPLTQAGKGQLVFAAFCLFGTRQIQEGFFLVHF